MVTRAELRAQRNAGEAPNGILSNTIAAQQTEITGLNGAIDTAHSSIVDAVAAVAAVEAAADLATAQAAVSGIGASLSGAQTGIESVRPDLIEA